MTFAARSRATAILVATLVAFILPLTAAATAETSPDFVPTPGKLPKTVVPLHYEIELAPDLDKLAFKGREKVHIEVLEPTDRLVLNALELTIETRIARRDRERGDRIRCGRADGDAHLPAAARGRPSSPCARLHRPHQSVRPRPVRGGLPRRRRAQAHDVVAARADRCAAHLSKLGRARLQGELRADRDCPANISSPSPTCRSSSRKRPATGSSASPSPRRRTCRAICSCSRIGELERITAEADGVTVGVVTTRGQDGARPLRARQRRRPAALLQ